MKENFIIYFFFIIFSLSKSAFIDSNYIKDLSSISAFDQELKKTKLSTGMMLIYSTGCGHCHHFLSTYKLLAEKYNNKILFFAMSVYSDYDKRMPRTYGVPYILFFSDGYFYPFKGRRSYEILSSIIENDYLPKCKTITYKNIEYVYYNIFMKNNEYNNLIIGFFDKNSLDNINNFRESNNLLTDESVGLCYVCNDFNEIQNRNESLFKFIGNNIIVGYLRNNISKIYLWDNNDKNKKYYNYEKFINEDLKSDYIDINENNKKYLINFLRNKNNLIFSYGTNAEKVEYQNYINEIKNFTKFQINYVLYSFSNFNENIFDSINKSGLYEINGELHLINKFNNIIELKNKIFNQFNKSNINYSNINNKLLIPDVKKENNTENEEEDGDVFDFDFFFEILEKICVILFTLVLTMAIFFFNYNRYYKKVDQNLLNYYSNIK